jgi:hypothetical protein
VPFPAFTTTIENYPYPLRAHGIHLGDAVSLPQQRLAVAQHSGPGKSEAAGGLENWTRPCRVETGMFNFVFLHTDGVLPPSTFAFIDYGVEKYGRRVKFLNYRKCMND